MKKEEPKEIGPELGDEEVEGLLFDDDKEIIGHALKIHFKDDSIPHDLVLFEADDKDRKFISAQHKLALTCYDFIIGNPHSPIYKDEDGISEKKLDKVKKVAKTLMQRLISEEVYIAILKRNRTNNPILSGMFNRPKEDDPVDGLTEAIKKRIPGLNNNK